MLSNPGCHVRTAHWFIGTHARGRQVTSLLCLSDAITSCRLQVLLGAFFKYENAVINGEQDDESISIERVG